MVRSLVVVDVPDVLALFRGFIRLNNIDNAVSPQLFEKFSKAYEFRRVRLVAEQVVVQSVDTPGREDVKKTVALDKLREQQ